MFNKRIQTPGYILGCCIVDGKQDNDGIQTYIKEEVFTAPFDCEGHRIIIKYAGYTSVCHTDDYERQGVNCYDTPKQMVLTADYQEIDSFHLIESGHGNDHYFDGKLELRYHIFTDELGVKISYKFNSAIATEIFGAWGFSIQLM